MPITKPHPTRSDSVIELVEEFDVPTRLVVDETAFERILERILERMERPRPPTPAMLALFRK